MSRKVKFKNLPDSFERLMEVVEHLRGPNGCPWDQKQNHVSLKQMLLEECYELLEAIDQDDPRKIAEEMGDLFGHLAFHCQIAKEAGEFEPKQVFRTINDKLERRHPHVFGSKQVKDSRDVEQQWEKLKQQENKAHSPVEGIPATLPALAHAQLMQKRVARVGFDWKDLTGVLDKVSEELKELQSGDTKDVYSWEVGDLLFSLVNLSRWLDIEAEDSLRQANARFSKRFIDMEEMCKNQTLDFESLSMEEKNKLWSKAKEREKLI